MATRRSRGPARRSYSMPEISGLYGPPPFEYREVNQLLVAFQTDPRALRRTLRGDA